jgi:hypothetical protein
MASISRDPSGNTTIQFVGPENCPARKPGSQVEPTRAANTAILPMGGQLAVSVVTGLRGAGSHRNRFSLTIREI